MTTLPHEKKIVDLEETIRRLKKQNDLNSVWTSAEIGEMEDKLQEMKKNVYTKLSPFSRVQICRHLKRPHALDYIKAIADEYVEIFGDRTFRDDPSIVVALVRIGQERLMIIGQEKGKDTEERLERNFGMPHPEGYRKALRAMQLAAKFQIPIVTLIDTPGAYPGLSAEERGQGWAIARNLLEMSRLPTPIIVVLIGEGCSGGALGIGVGDVIGMLEHAYYSVISPEGCASILWKDTAKAATAASALRMHVDDLLDLKIVDAKIPEPLGGAHMDPSFVYNQVKLFILCWASQLKSIPIDTLLQKRYNKFRLMGRCTGSAK